MTTPVDVLAIGSHPDDVEMTCAGLLLRSADQGYATGVLHVLVNGTPVLRDGEHTGATHGDGGGDLRDPGPHGAGADDADAETAGHFTAPVERPLTM